MLNKVIAILVGIVVAFGIIAATEKLGHTLYPPPPDVDFADADAFAAYVDSQPVLAIAFVLIAWVVGAFAGALVGSRLSQPTRPLAAFVVTALVFAGGVANMVIIAHPLWFMVGAVIGIPLAGIAAWKLAAPGGSRTAD